MSNKKEIAIFCAALLAIAATFAAGVILVRRQVELTSIVPDTGVASATTTLNTATATSTAPAPIVFTLPYLLGPSIAKYWREYWGVLAVTNGELVLSASSTTSGGSAFLNDNASWTDYTAETNIQWQTGGWFDMVMRATNYTENFVYCEFGSSTLGIVERVNGTDMSIAGGIMPPGVVSPTDLGMSVYGADVGCLVNGKEALGAVIKQNESASGGVGFIAWGERAKNQLVVKSFAVTSLAKNTIQVPFSVPVPVVASVKKVAGTSVTSTKSTATKATSTPAIAVPPAPAEASQPFILPYSESSFTGDASWQRIWGTMAIASSGFMEVGANSSDNGGGTWLKGSSAWTNYTFTATVDWAKGGTFSLMARYNNGDNYMSCEFDNDGQVYIHQILNGRDQVVGQGIVWNIPATGDIQASIAVNESHISCGLDGGVILPILDNFHTFIPPGLLMGGGIGVSTWDPQINNSQIIVKQVSVTPFY